MQTPATPRAASRSGMTLIELLVVMAIILVLMGMVIGIAGASQRGAAEAKAKSQIGQIVLELEKFRGDRGSLPPDRHLPYPHDRPSLGTEFFDWYQKRYPNTVFDMTESTFDTPNLTPQNLDTRILLDPWGNAYRYEKISEFIYILGSHGPNGTWNNGTLDDITSRNLN